ncbi:hypothetical protein NNJEOMEG_02761 [Fundidesulfovibrio magnetotacticus]|uniref:Uncharacterized protein n=1 Tax=Fundidesulfovibrio magnetotacticus TaxID=2730080 RepID=A0A6V8LR02_9BACT|nr:hypothetical protein [Fundidesulfovibrio magnetotacticus]GFK94913.1 hypothetical protein NNJEOMEG_02761 [Fundidesulfovibrio magnetotacticus]
MRGDDIQEDNARKRGAVHHETPPSRSDEARPDLVTPPAGRDVAVMFWESIGMKPGDDWRVRASGRPGETPDEDPSRETPR